MFNSLFKRETSHQQEALSVYEAAVEKSRQSKFYAEMAVPDTMDGRFEMIVLHVTLEMLAFEKQNISMNTQDIKNFQQALFDIMFVDMDQSLREAGIGDYSIAKHMRRMMKGFNGRAHAYKKALETKGDKLLEDVVSRNIYGTLKDIDTKKRHAMMAYIKKEYKGL